MGPIMMGPDEVGVGGDESDAAAARVRGGRGAGQVRGSVPIFWSQVCTDIYLAMRICVRL